jgi:hypothetical protein
MNDKTQWCRWFKEKRNMLKTARRKTRDTIFYIKIITLELMMINSMLKVSMKFVKGLVLFVLSSSRSRWENNWNMYCETVYNLYSSLINGENTILNRERKSVILSIPSLLVCLTDCPLTQILLQFDLKTIIFVNPYPQLHYRRLTSILTST